MSSLRRVYVPLSLTEFDQLAAGKLRVQGDEESITGHAVTAAHNVAHPDADDEEREYEATIDAAYTAAHAFPGDRAIVAAIDVPKDSLRESGTGSIVQVHDSLDLRFLACWFVSDARLTTDLIDAADEDPSLQWFGPEEAAMARAFAVQKAKARAKAAKRQVT